MSEWFDQPDETGQPGLRFACTMCGNCCTGPEGYVLVSDTQYSHNSAETAAQVISAALAADPDEPVEPQADTLSMRFALVRTALAALRPRWPGGASPPLGFAGFSGGATLTSLRIVPGDDEKIST